MTAARKGAPRKPRAVASITPQAAPMPIGDDVIVFHPDELTVKQIEDIEEASGLPIVWLYDPEKPKGAITRAVAFVLCREHDPSFTMEQAGAKRVFIRAEPQLPPTGESA